MNTPVIIKYPFWQMAVQNPRYADEHHFFNTRFFVDDGFSGVSFEREGLQAMLREVEAGNVATVITKDLSRLGRNYLKTGELIEIIFPENDVRYIAINDGVDTAREDNEFTPLRNWFAIIDPENEYSSLVRRLGGQVIDISPASDQFINPMDLTLNYSEDDNPLTLKSDFMEAAVTGLENKAKQARNMLAGLWKRITECAKNAVEHFKEAGVTALDKAVSVLHVKNVLEALQEHLSGMIDDTKQNMKKVENIGHELRSVGGHLKNAGRAMAGKEAQAVDGGQAGRFQSAVLAPMRGVKKLLSGMNNATLAAIGGVEHLEQKADAARERREERAAEKPGKRLAKKPSIRQMLKKHQAEIAAKSVPAPDREKKQEAAL